MKTKAIFILMLLLTQLGLQGCEAIIGGAAGAAVYEEIEEEEAED